MSEQHRELQSERETRQRNRLKEYRRREERYTLSLLCAMNKGTLEEKEQGRKSEKLKMVGGGASDMSQ